MSAVQRKTSRDPWRKAWKLKSNPTVTLRCVHVTPRDSAQMLFAPLPPELSFLPCDFIEEIFGALGQTEVMLGSIPRCPLLRVCVGLNNVWGPGRTHQEWLETSLCYCCDDPEVDAHGCRYLQREKEEQGSSEGWRKESSITPLTAAAAASSSSSSSSSFYYWLLVH